MKYIPTIVEHEGQRYIINLGHPINISLPVKRQGGPNAFYLNQAVYETVVAGGFTGNVAAGGSCNCENIHFNPHGNGTHTECAGHVSATPMYINEVLKKSFFPAVLISVPLQTDGLGNSFISAAEVIKQFPDNGLQAEALLIRTLPNNTAKKEAMYSGNNAPYFEPEVIPHLNTMGIMHVLTDLPSLDKEDDAKLTALKDHKKSDEGFHIGRTQSQREQWLKNDQINIDNMSLQMLNIKKQMEDLKTRAQQYK